MTTHITPQLVSENSFSGARRWKLNKRDAATLVAWEDFDITKVRGSHGVRKDGTIHFTTGGGYAIFDADLLGGTGDGAAERRANDAGLYIRLT